MPKVKKDTSRRINLRKLIVIGTTPLLVSAVLVFGSAKVAEAMSCASTPTTPSCNSTGNLSLTGGSLTLVAPTSLNWSGTTYGTNLSLYDANAAEQGYQVHDDSGTGAGWHVTLRATTFMTDSAQAESPSTITSLSTNGSLYSASSSAAPAASCEGPGSCKLPVNTTAYPVVVPTSASSQNAVTIFNAARGSGLGNIQIGGSSASNPVGWWLSLPEPSNSNYTAILTFSIISGP